MPTLKPLPVLVLFCALPVLSAFGQQGSAPHSHVQWTYDAARGQLQASLPAVQSSSPVIEATAAPVQASTTYDGTVLIKFTVNLASPVPAKAVVRCSGSVALQYQVEEKPSPKLTVFYGYILQNTNSIDAVVKGSTATCSFKIPYEWVLPESTTAEPVTVIGVTAAAGIAYDALNANGDVARALRSTSAAASPLSSIPANGATTTFTIDTTI